MINKEIIAGVKLNEVQKEFCDSCMLGKQHRLSFNKSRSRKTRVGELVHADLCGPMSVDSVGGSKYFLLLKDDYSGYHAVYFLRHKSDVIERFKNFENEFNNRFGYHII